jgi:formylglycine-generating enzyme required for sulfatase activity/Tfp pilus assembly protein PilF
LSLKSKLVTALTARFLDHLRTLPPGKALADYAAVSKLDPQAAGRLIQEFGFLPASVLSQLPVSVLSQLPVNVLVQLPASVLLQVPPRKNSIGMQFKLLPGGTFTMGTVDFLYLGATPHRVTLTKPFELGVYEVTQEQYVKVMGANPSVFKGLRKNPVERVSWNDTVEFCRKLSELPSEKAAGYVYRLPTEAEWEYACRAGTQTAYSFGDSESELGDYAWYDPKAVGTTHPVGSKKPNAWGLYDMHGNVHECCQDWAKLASSGSVTDPTGAASGRHRVYRGGSWGSSALNCRSAYRRRYVPDGPRDSTGLDLLGFRVLRTHGNKGEHDQAIKDYTEAIRLKPDYAKAYNNRGYVYDEKGEYDLAIKDYTEAIRLKPDYAVAYYFRGYVYGNKGEYDLAIKDYTEAIRLKPDDADAYLNRGFAYGDKGEYDQAIKDYTEAIRLKPDYAKAYYNRGVAYQKRGLKANAAADFAKAKELGYEP